MILLGKTTDNVEKTEVKTGFVVEKNETVQYKYNRKKLVFDILILLFVVTPIALFLVLLTRLNFVFTSDWELLLLVGILVIISPPFLLLRARLSDKIWDWVIVIHGPSRNVFLSYGVQAFRYGLVYLSCYLFTPFFIIDIVFKSYYLIKHRNVLRLKE